MIKVIKYTVIFVITTLVSGCFLLDFGQKNEQRYEVVKSIKQENHEKQEKQIESYKQKEIHQDSKVVRTEHIGEIPKSAQKNELSTKIKIDISKQLFQVNMAFKIKDKANIDEIIKAELLIDTHKDLKELLNNIKIEGAEISSQIKASKIVFAKLNAPYFEVINLTNEEQPLNEENSTQWLWQLKPLKSGIHEINLTITALVKVDDKTSTYHIKTYDEKVTIEITPKQILINWLEKNWQWLISTLLLPLGIWYYKRYNDRKSERN